jgi:hypothetical protein
MYERNTALQINDCTPACTKPLLADAILFRGRHSPVNEELKSLSDEGRTRAWACTLFALFVRLPCAWQKRKVCANALLIEGLAVVKRDTRTLSPDSRILSRYDNFLNPSVKFLFAVVSFLKRCCNFLGKNEKSLCRVGSLLKQEGSFARADNNSLFRDANFLSQVVRLLLFGSCKL